MGNDASIFACDYSGDAQNYPMNVKPEALYGIPYNGSYANTNACAANNQGYSMYKNGEFVPDGREGSCLRRATGGGSPDEKCKNGGAGGCASGLCGPNGCCYNEQHPRFKRQFFLAPKEVCVLSPPKDGVVKVGDYWLTCNPDWLKPDNAVNQDVMKNHCATADLNDGRCKTFCASFPELCVPLIQSRCNSAATLGVGLCNDLCNTNKRTGNVAAACNGLINDVCKGANLTSNVCQTMCFSNTTSYDCKLELEKFCNLKENQNNPMCACYLPPSSYVNYYGQLFAGLADPNVAATLQSQAQAVPYCSYPPCSTNESFKPRALQKCPNQQICLQQIVNKGGKAVFNGNVNLNQECNLLVNELNDSPAKKGIAATMSAIKASGTTPTPYSILADTTITAVGSQKPLEYAAVCLTKQVNDPTDPEYNVTDAYDTECGKAVRDFCGTSAANLGGEFCQMVCNTTPDYAGLKTACAAAVDKVCKGGGVNGLQSEICATLCFSEETPYDCTTNMKEFCETSPDNGATWWNKYASICPCHMSAARYTAFFENLLSGAEDGEAKTQLTAATLGVTRNPATSQAQLDKLVAYSVNRCVYSPYWPRSMNPPSAENAKASEREDCVADMRTGKDILGAPILIYQGDLSTATNTCKKLIKDLALKPTVPESELERPPEETGNEPTLIIPSTNEKATAKSSVPTGPLLALIAIAVLFLLVRSKGAASEAAPAPAMPAYAQGAPPYPPYAMPMAPPYGPNYAYGP